MDEWSDWIQHDGNRFPYGEFVPIIARYQSWDGYLESEGHSGDCLGSWLKFYKGKPLIICYKVKKPKGIKVLENILKEVELVDA